MFSITLIAALGSAVLWSVVNILDDVLKQHVYTNAFEGVIISALFGSTMIGTAAFFPIAAISWLNVGLGLLVAIASSFGFLLYFKSFELETPSTVVALWNLIPVYLLMISQLLGEDISLLGYLASCVIVIGSFTLTFNFKRFKLSKAYGLMVISSLCLAISAVAEFKLLQVVDFSSGLFYIGLGNLVSLLLFTTCFQGGRVVIKRSPLQWKQYWWLFVASEGINLLAVALNTFAVSQGAVTVVKVVEASQAAFILLISVLFHRVLPKYLRESWRQLTLKKVLSFTAIIGGLVALNVLN